MEPQPYTLWNEETGEVYATGKSTAPTVPDGMDELAIHIGEEVNWETCIFDRVTRLPVLRAVRKPIDPAEVSALVNRERQRRIEKGKSFGGIWVTGSDKDVSNLTNLALGAQLRVSMGDTTTTTFRDGNNDVHDLTPLQVIGLWQAASLYVQAIYAASWALKGMDLLPIDFAEDSYWPA